MDLNEIKSLIKEIITNQIGKTLNCDDLLIENGVDSITMINIVLTIENHFDIEFEPEKLNYTTLKTISSVAQYILYLINKK